MKNLMRIRMASVAIHIHADLSLNEEKKTRRNGKSNDGECYSVFLPPCVVLSRVHHFHAKQMSSTITTEFTPHLPPSHSVAELSCFFSSQNRKRRNRCQVQAERATAQPTLEGRPGGVCLDGMRLLFAARLSRDRLHGWNSTQIRRRDWVCSSKDPSVTQMRSFYHIYFMMSGFMES